MTLLSVLQPVVPHTVLLWRCERLYAQNSSPQVLDADWLRSHSLSRKPKRRFALDQQRFQRFFPWPSVSRCCVPRRERAISYVIPRCLHKQERSTVAALGS